LKILCSKIKTSGDIDLKKIAMRCKYYTGADLQAMLYNAQLYMIHDILSNNNITNQEDEKKDKNNNAFTVFKLDDGIIDLAKDVDDIQKRVLHSNNQYILMIHLKVKQIQSGISTELSGEFLADQV
jgi:SpoVK/Ycf46/Vps4 family AAA+-type ATPase